jgi:hypothetical protein
MYYLAEVRGTAANLLAADEPTGSTEAPKWAKTGESGLGG